MIGIVFLELIVLANVFAIVWVLWFMVNWPVWAQFNI